MYGDEDQTSALRASPAQVTMLTSRPASASPPGAVNGYCPGKRRGSVAGFIDVQQTVIERRDDECSRLH
jgi:hypothetical protein